MHAGIRIRRAEDDDALALSVLAEKTFRAAFEESNSPANMQLHCAANYGQALQLAEIREPSRETWVAEADKRLVAYVQLRLNAASSVVLSELPVEIQSLRGRFASWIRIGPSSHGTRSCSSRGGRLRGAMARSVGAKSKSVGFLSKMGV